MTPAETLDFVRARFNVSQNASGAVGLHISRHRELIELWRDLGCKVGAEIGTEAGKYAEEICRGIPGVKLFCVDPYLAYSRYKDQVSQDRLDHFYAVAQSRLTGRNQFDAHFIRAPSLDAVRQFKPASLDFVFIDGNHHFDFVVQDIIAWAPIVKPGGIVAGHDYKPEGSEHTPIPFGVIEAVNAYTAAHKIGQFFLCKSDKCPSWFWVSGNA